MHNHFAGAAYPDWFISYAKADPDANWCVQFTNYKAYMDNNCAENGGVLLKTLQPDSDNYLALVSQWSMKNFVLAPPDYGYHHFFSAFSLVTNNASSGL